MDILVGDILQSKAQTLINTVNCVGVMGKGIALEFKKRYPEMFADYARRCARGEVKPGVPYLYTSLFPPQIVNFPTKDHWKSVSRIEDIKNGLEILVSQYRDWGIASLAIPPLGCGNGQLEWRVVGPLICRYARLMQVPIELYAPYGTSPRELTVEFLEQEPKADQSLYRSATVQSALNPAWIALVEIVKRIEEQPYHWPVGRVIFQKIAYVATRQGLPTGLVYTKGSFGPFSSQLKEATTRLVNANLLQEERLGQVFSVKVGPNYSEARKKYEPFLATWNEVIEKTTDLFMRMHTTQAEIVATVLFAADALAKSKGAAPGEREVLEAVMQWKQKRLDETAVAGAIRNLAMLRWLQVQYDPSLPLTETESLLA